MPIFQLNRKQEGLSHGFDVRTVGRGEQNDTDALVARITERGRERAERSHWMGRGCERRSEKLPHQGRRHSDTRMPQRLRFRKRERYRRGRGGGERSEQAHSTELPLSKEVPYQDSMRRKRRENAVDRDAAWASDYGKDTQA
jgi:hypothetical protein